MTPDAVPTLPVPLAGLVKHIAQHPETPMVELLAPYRKYEAHLRQAFAQNAGNELLQDAHVNVLPLFTDDVSSVKIRARQLEREPEEEKAKYIMPLPAKVRRPDGSPAVVQSVKEFQRNFNVFSESTLVELDWDNVVAAGSSVVNCLVPVPEEYAGSKRGLREFYHEKFCPASDVDLFLYGLTEAQAIEKIKAIETRVRDALLTETTVVRTKHAVTICSQYPTRHIQIVLRIYKSVSEILTGFDIDCSGAAYDGKQVYCSPRALQSYMTQINHVDLSRRSPSYENRLSKYGHRGFEVYWPDLERSRIDPTIFERSFQRTLGLARLLVLERLPTSSARDKYLDQRREERGRPAIDRFHRDLRALQGNIKEEHEDEVADWLTEDEVSNYHTFTIPYGPRFHAKRIEKLCYTRDLLLNAEWNQPDDREVYLHRHPAFFGRSEDVVRDCCGYCPVPETEEEKAVAEEEAKVYVSGAITFMKDDPGRQTIGSFNPLTDDDWTEMAYVGNTARLCQAIVDGDVEHVADWLSQDGADPNSRDYTGRTPLHLAAMASTPAVVQALVDAGARLVARLADGRTALHLAAARGSVEIVKILLQKSNANEAEHEEQQDQRRREKTAATRKEVGPAAGDGESANHDGDESESESEGEGDGEESDGELIDGSESDDGGQSMATGSFVKVRTREADPADDAALQANDDEPDFYDINVIAWDVPCSALHLAIIEGHVEVVKTLVQEFGADVLLPVKFFAHQKKPSAALLTLVLALALPVAKATEMAKTLLSLGATSAQADINGITAFHVFVEEKAVSLLETLWESDPTGTAMAINHISFANYNSSSTPLQVAVKAGNLAMVLKLLDHGAVPDVDFETWLKSAKQAVNMANQLRTFEENKKQYNKMVEQPLIHALNSSTPATALALLEHGADPNVITSSSHYYMQVSYHRQFEAQSALDIADKHLDALRGYDGNEEALSQPSLPDGIDTYLDRFEKGSYEHWAVSEDIKRLREAHRVKLEKHEKKNAKSQGSSGLEEKKAAIEEAIETMDKVKAALLAKGAKTFAELYPDFADRVEAPSRRRGPRANERDEPYKYDMTFQNVTDVTEARKVAYLKLFNAARNGHLETIKTLTLTAWDDAKEQAPLKIAVRDRHGNNPFSLAFYNRHYDVATAVLEIAQAQYAPEDKPKTRYQMKPADDDSVYSDDDSECSDAESAHSDGSTPRIYSHIVDGQFTIDNVGQVSMKVNSRTKPLEMFGWTHPLDTVIRENDMKGLKFLLGVGERLSAQRFDSDDEVSSFYSFPDRHFERAVELGRVELLGEIIKRTGGGLPLEHLVKDTGLELKEKPRFYQGLTVYGKKRKDWANAGREMVRKPGGTQTSPLLLAALDGRIESVEWFLSDTPSRHYLAFAKSKAAREDAKLKHLAQAPGGVDGAISKWLNDQHDLILHAAIIANPTQRATDLVSYLIKTQSSLLEVRAANGATPLLLACRLGRLDIVKRLVDAGADQTAKDRGRNNMMHAVLHTVPSAEKLEALLSLLDRKILIPMLKERNRLEHSGRTPLHQCLDPDGATSSSSAKRIAGVFQLLAALSPATARAAHRVLDGTGDTPLHSLLAQDASPALVRAVIDFDPSLLFCENAVGRTPAEVAHGRALADRIQAPCRYSIWRPDASVSALVSATPASFAAAPKEHEHEREREREHESVTTVARNWRLCARTIARVAQPRRTLVSLHAANFVAQRLGQQHMKARHPFRLVGGAEAEDEDDASGASGSHDGDGAGDLGSGRAAPAAVMDKAKVRRADVITARYGLHNRAWVRPKTEGEGGDGCGGSVEEDSCDDDEEDDSCEDDDEEDSCDDDEEDM